MKKVFTVIILTMCIQGAANAALVTRLGGQALYDTDLNLTWLADSRVVSETVFDDGVSNTDGRSTWASATTWADNFSLSNNTDWRLPTVIELEHLYTSELGGTQGPMGSLLNSSDPDLAKFINLDLSGSYWTNDVVSVPSITVAYVYLFSGGFNVATIGSQSAYALAVHQGDVTSVPAPATLGLILLSLGASLTKKRRNIT